MVSSVEAKNASCGYVCLACILSLSLSLSARFLVQELRESLSELAEACLTHLPNLLAKYQVRVCSCSSHE